MILPRISFSPKLQPQPLKELEGRKIDAQQDHFHNADGVFWKQVFLPVEEVVLHYGTGKLALVAVVPLEQVRNEGSRVSFHWCSQY